MTVTCTNRLRLMSWCQWAKGQSQYHPQQQSWRAAAAAIPTKLHLQLAVGWWVAVMVRRVARVRLRLVGQSTWEHADIFQLKSFVPQPNSFSWKEHVVVVFLSTWLPSSTLEGTFLLAYLLDVLRNKKSGEFQLQPPPIKEYACVFSTLWIMFLVL